MTIWNLGPAYETLHGVFNRGFEPVLTIDSGDTVIYKTLEAGWGLEPRDPHNAGQKPLAFEPTRSERRGNGHCLVGPIAIRGAEPGMTLEVVIEEIVVGDWGWTATWKNPTTSAAGVQDNDEVYLVWKLNHQEKLGTNQYGHEVSLRPFMGVMGMPIDEPGDHVTFPPRRTGGNLDCKELIAGTSLFLPIAVSGGLFSVGDGHAAQGDGEVSVTAIECGMDRVRLQFILHTDMSLSAPRAHIPGATITFGLDEDLNQAAHNAVQQMVDVIVERLGVSRSTALALASVTVDLRITQHVNGVKGVHAILRDDAIRTNQ